MISLSTRTVKRIQALTKTIEKSIVCFDADNENSVVINNDGTIYRSEDMIIGLEIELEKDFQNNVESLKDTYNRQLTSLDKYVKNLFKNDLIQTMTVVSSIKINDKNIPYLNIHCTFNLKDLINLDFKTEV